VTTLSLTTGYAIEALACLARQGSDSMLVREIAQLTDMPLPYLSKIFQRLGDAGIVETKRGYKGGVKLVRPPAEINLLAIDAAVENSRAEAGSDPAGDSPRPNTFWQAFHKEYREKLAAMTLADVLIYETQP
jgi:Rrf2 family transcriptional regulator, iron-sulfur cluster assembly transcription factor